MPDEAPESSAHASGPGEGDAALRGEGDAALGGEVGAARRGEVDAARRLAEIFGDVLPESTRDDRDPPTADRGDDADRWYTDNRPPHHEAR